MLMFTKQTKKMLIFDIYEILQKYSDVNHRLTQRDIERYLEDKYDMTVDRKSIKRNIMDLIDMDIDIQWTEKTRFVKCKQTGEMEEQSVYTDFYLQRDLSDCEIRFLVDVLSDLDFISYNYKRELVKKLENLSSVYFRKKPICDYHNNIKNNNQVFYSLEVIDEAINNHNKVYFTYKCFEASDAINSIVVNDEHLVTPIDTTVNDGDYYLICNEKSNCNLIYRLDNIYDIKIVE